MKTKMRMMKNNSHFYKTAGTVMSLLGFILILIPLVSSLFLVVPRIFGIKEYTVITPSMEPTIPVGSIVLVKPTDFEEIRVGDVISYTALHHSDVVVTHRVTEIDPDAGTITTKGDANEGNDINPVEKWQIIGVVIYSLPGAGQVLQYAATLPGIALIVMMFVAGTILTSAGSRFSGERKKSRD